MKSLFKKLPFYRNYTTNQHKKWWKNRSIDWQKDYLDTWNHPHRGLIVSVLKKLSWLSLIEIGCGSGANLMRILKEIPGIQVGGVDINEDAIKLATESFKGALLKVGSADDIMLSDNSCDIILSDMLLIYVGDSMYLNNLSASL